MPKPLVTIRPFDVATATAEEQASVYGLICGLQAEEWPEDPPRPFDDWLRVLQSIPPFVTLRIWVAWDGVQAVGRATFTVTDTPENRHIAEVDIGVATDRRRRGIGKRLLAWVVSAAEEHQRTLLIGGTDSRIPAGEALAQRLGGHVGMVARTNQLDLATLDLELMRAWREKGPSEAFELGWWRGSYPEEELASVCTLKAVMNTAPRDDLDVEDIVWTPEMVRQQTHSLFERRIERLTLFARHRTSAELAGYTEVFFDRTRPEILHQGDTGVLPRYRGHGLGKWLKATMIEEALAKWPQLKRVRTGNANSNAPMLRINDAMGFRPCQDWSVWQVDIAQARAYARSP